MTNNPLPRIAFASATALALAAALGGCATFDAGKARAEHTEYFTNSVAALSRKLLAEPLSLRDAIGIAMTNNYEIRKADLDAELARLGRNQAFSAFLPRVSISAGYNNYAKDPMVSSQEFSTGEINIGMPLFMPSTWFLYSAARHGAAAGELSAHYVRQAITLQTTRDYCDILVQQDLVKALGAQLEAAKENASRIKGLADEGLVNGWESGQAQYLAVARQVQLDQAKRELEVLDATFLSHLGLAPNAEFTLDGDTETAAPGFAPGTPLDEIVLGALETHPLLSIADRDVVAKEDGVRQALCDFLPVVNVFGIRNWTGNDVMARSANWLNGFNAAWTVFEGFANISRYNASKVELEKASLERENTFLGIIVNIVAADAAWCDATDAARLSQIALEVANEKAEDYDARNREGLLPLGDALDARAQRDLAEIEAVKSRYQEQIARTALEFAAGAIAVPEAPRADSRPQPARRPAMTPRH